MDPTSSACAKVAAIASVAAGITMMALPGADGLALRSGGASGNGLAFANSPMSLLSRGVPASSASSSRMPLSQLMMAKGGKGGKSGKKVTPPSSSSPVTPPASASPAPASAAAPKKATPSAAFVDDNGVEDPEIFSKAVAALDEGRSKLGDGAGFGPGPAETWMAPNGKSYTIGENERMGYSGDASIVKATSKTVTVRLEGKFWGTRRWALDSVAKCLGEKLPGIRVVIEDENQLVDRYIKDVFYGENAWALRKVGPQYVNERGIQVAQPFTPDGKIRDIEELNALNFEGSALQLGIEEMMQSALKQTKGNAFTSSAPLDRLALDKALAESQTAYFSESDSESSEERSLPNIADDDNIESVTRVPLTNINKAAMGSNVDELMAANPMFQMMSEMLEDEPGALNDIQELLEKSNGNMFSIMTNPKFQKLAQKMMQNPELMTMMQDPSQIQNAMRSAESLGITGAMGIDPKAGGKSLTDATIDIVKDSAANTLKPDWLKAVEVDVSSRSKKALQDSNASQRSRPTEPVMPVAKPRVAAEERSDGSFSIGAFLEESEDAVSGSRDMVPASAGGGEMSDAMKENLLYLGGGIFGVSAIIFFLAAQMGIVDLPFMNDLGVVSTPATRRMDSPSQGASKAAKVVVPEPADDTPF